VDFWQAHVEQNQRKIAPAYRSLFADFLLAGRVVPGYTAKIVDEHGEQLPRGQVGRLAVKGPTGCRYLDDARQANYVQDSWNVPGDAFSQDEDGYFVYQARTDDMIITAGYNVAGPEVESALLQHPAVLAASGANIAFHLVPWSGARLALRSLRASLAS
jgi:non-ribosomal peptide synthetase component E (peptide arylation enzyme)